jgi:hypothetical protein
MKNNDFYCVDYFLLFIINHFIIFHYFDQTVTESMAKSVTESTLSLAVYLGERTALSEWLWKRTLLNEIHSVHGAVRAALQLQLGMFLQSSNTAL